MGSRSSPREVLLGKDDLKICGKFTGHLQQHLRGAASGVHNSVFLMANFYRWLNSGLLGQICKEINK